MFTRYNGYLLGFIANVRHLQYPTPSGYLQFKVSFQVTNDADGCSFHSNVGSNDGVTITICHCSCNLNILLHCLQRQRASSHVSHRSDGWRHAGEKERQNAYFFNNRFFHKDNN